MAKVFIVQSLLVKIRGKKFDIDWQCNRPDSLVIVLQCVFHE